MELEIGLTNSKSVVVSENNVASSAGSGLLDVFATPYMIALMEQTAGESVQPCLDDGYFTVGTAINVSHVSATPIGMKVTATSTITEINNKEIIFSVKAEDEYGLIGEGTHKRFIVNGEKFIKKVYSKQNN